MDMMPSRYQMLQEALAGYEKTGMPLVAYDGKTLMPAGYGDDVGVYYSVPKIAHTFGLTIDQTIAIFYTGVILVSLILGLIGSYLLFKTWVGRLVALVGLSGLILFSLEVGDIYPISTYITIAIVPLFLYFAQSKKLSVSFVIFFLLAGISIGAAHYIRSHAGTAVLIFMLSMVMFYLRFPWRKKLVLAIPLVAGILVMALYFNVLLNQREAYLVNNQPACNQAVGRHPFWHSVYIGFGYLNNDYGIGYKDEVAIEKVRSISPSAPYLSEEYEAILKDEVINLIKGNPRFVLDTVFAKIGVIFFFLLIFANFGLLAAILYPKGWSIEVAFWNALGFNSLFGILVTPNPAYLLGFIAFATIYGIVSINHAIECGAWRDITARLSCIGVRS
ncbi:MAG: hypothetical protein IBX64_06130 [Actinobacteria bacterium]|nr:hypothetical protein [Actinomycetota bacterium]